MQKQHVDFFKKKLLRKSLLGARPRGFFYVPFIGDGDIAAEMYQDCTVFGADLDVQRVESARQRINGDIRVADCNGFPFSDVKEPFDCADFDAYCDPYKSFLSFWQKADKAKKMALFFTDGHRQAISRFGKYNGPLPLPKMIPDLSEKRKLLNFYFAKYVFPWFTEYIKPHKVVRKMFYLRHWMLYWGAVVKDG